LPSPDRLIGPWFWVGFLSQALPNQQVVDYPSFKLVIVGDGGTGDFLCPSFMPRMLFFNSYVDVGRCECRVCCRCSLEIRRTGY
jgi:hypothetical protein